MLKLNQVVTFGKNIKHICIPKPNIPLEGKNSFVLGSFFISFKFNQIRDVSIQPPEGSGCKLYMSGMLISLCSSCHGIWKFVGWGTICYGCDTSSKLMELYLPIWRQKECVDAYWTKSKYSIVDSQLCAGFKDGKKDSCQVLCSFPQINRLIELSK